MCIRDRFKIHDADKDKKIKNPVSIESNSGNITDSPEALSAIFSKSFNADKTSDAEQTINNSCKLLNECSDINNNTNKKENNTMVKVTVNVTGMMCGHCEAHVNKAIQEAFGVQDVVSVSYTHLDVYKRQIQGYPSVSASGHM